jgi:hypothetical protein
MKDFLHKSFGIEIEFKNVNLNKVAKELRALKLRDKVRYCKGWAKSNGDCWDIKTDNSVTTYCEGSRYGGEIASPILYPSRAAFLEVETVYNALNKLQAKFDKSCGLHIHVNINGIDKFKLILALLKYEQNLYEGFSKSRRSSFYAKPIKRLTDEQMAKKIHKKMGEIMIQNKLEQFLLDQKYSAFHFYERNNGKLKMLELRMGEANGNVAHALEWIKLVLRLLKYSRDEDTMDILTI